MKIHLIIPKSRLLDRLYGCIYAFFVQQNIFMLYPVTMLQRHGYEVEVTDLNVDTKKRLSEIIAKDDSDAYAFYSIFLSREVDLKAADEINKMRGATIVFMGSDPSYEPEAYLKDENYYVIRGEMEYAIVDLMNNLDHPSDVGGLSYIRKGKIIENISRPYIRKLDELPFPNRNLLKNPKKYPNPRFNRFPSTTMLTSRGCSYHCIYCVPNSLSFARELEWKKFHHKKPPVTLRSSENVIEEFTDVAEQGYRSVQIVDDVFIWKKRVVEICRGIKDLDLQLSCLSRADHLLNERMIKEMAEAGFSHIDIGLESFDQRILDYIRKDMSIQNFYKAFSLLKKWQIEPEINILLGASSLETKNTIRNTEKLLKKLKFEILHCQICAPFPGTEFYEMAKDRGWIVTGDYIPVDPMESSIISYPHLSKEELEDAVRRINRGHYLHFTYLLRQLANMRSWRKFRHRAGVMLKMFIKWRE